MTLQRSPMPARTSPMPRTPFRSLSTPAREEKFPWAARGPRAKLRPVSTRRAAESRQRRKMADETFGGRPAHGLSWTPFTYPMNLTGQPACSVPCGLSRAGLPVGLQIVGRWRGDEAVIRGAAAFEAVRPWTHLRPPINNVLPAGEKRRDG